MPLYIVIPVAAFFLAVAVWNLILMNRHFKREKQAIDEKYARQKRILGYRRDLFEKMQQNCDSKFVIIKNREIPLKERLALMYELDNKNHIMWKTWDSIDYEKIKDQDAPIETFYTPEVLDKLLWKFDSEKTA